MKKSNGSVLFLFTSFLLTSGAAFAGDYRIGFGVSQFEALGNVNTEKGFTLEYEYDWNDIVGLHSSFSQGDYKINEDGNSANEKFKTFKVGIDVGWTLYANDMGLKPYVSAGVHTTKWRGASCDITSVCLASSDRDTNIYHGVGIRTSSEYVYMQLAKNTLHYNIGGANIDLDQVRLTVGITF
ncbi:outer membrane beta-barrel protein [Photobacterium satsumensis]|uniref:outer membrane beta-barrel protein n=1 Tax=Photobacterium satsumensis TaxID=2910239 RepID=UPI003D0C94AB